MKGKAARAYLDGFATVKSVLELDVLTVREIVEAVAGSGKTRSSIRGSGATTQPFGRRWGTEDALRAGEVHRCHAKAG